MVRCILSSCVGALVCVVGFGLTARADEPGNLAQVEELLDANTMIVARVDVQGLDLAPLVEMMRSVEEQSGRGTTRWSSAVWDAQEVQRTLTDAGVTDLFALVRLIDLPSRPPIVALVCQTSQQAQDLPARLRRISSSSVQADVAPLLKSVRVEGNLVVISPGAALGAGGTSHLEGQLTAALSCVPDAPVQVAYVPSRDHHKVLRDGAATLPEPLRSLFDQAQVADVSWATVGLRVGPSSGLQLVVQAVDAAHARKLNHAVTNLRSELSKHPFLQRFPVMLSLLNSATIATDQNRLTVSVLPSGDAVQMINRQLLSVLTSAQQAAVRAEVTNDLKQLAMAILNFQSSYRGLPPAASYDDEGKPLLSWRVFVLPFLGHEDLYRQFHLAEPWDSPHNRQLIAKMPDIFRHPNVVEAGKTVYLAPVGADTAIAPRRGVVLSDIKDGPSKTILVIEAPLERAVIWTKPEDLTIEGAKDSALVGREFHVAFVDGHTRSIPSSVDARTLWGMCTIAGGE